MADEASRGRSWAATPRKCCARPTFPCSSCAVRAIRSAETYRYRSWDDDDRAWPSVQHAHDDGPEKGTGYGTPAVRAHVDQVAVRTTRLTGDCLGDRPDEG